MHEDKSWACTGQIICYYLTKIPNTGLAVTSTSKGRKEEAKVKWSVMAPLRGVSFH